MLTEDGRYMLTEDGRYMLPGVYLSMVIVDSDVVVRQVSLGQTWCLILSLVSVWSSPLYDMSVCPLLTWQQSSVISISC